MVSFFTIAVIVIVAIKALASLNAGDPGQALLFVFAGLLFIWLGAAIRKSVKMADHKLTSASKDAEKSPFDDDQKNTELLTREVTSDPYEPFLKDSFLEGSEGNTNQRVKENPNQKHFAVQCKVDNHTEKSEASVGEVQQPAARNNGNSANIEKSEVAQSTSSSLSHKLADISWQKFSLTLGVLFLAFVIIRMLSPSTPPGYALPNAIGGFTVHLVIGSVFAGVTWFISKQYVKAVFLIAIAVMILLVTITQNTSYANFHDCMLQKMSGQSDNMRSVAAAECRRLFPN